jgi:hypothetical protein
VPTFITTKLTLADGCPRYTAGGPIETGMGE